MDLPRTLIFAAWGLSTAGTVAVLGVCWRRRAQLPPALRWFTLHLGLILTGDLMQLVLVRYRVNNHWVGYLVVPMVIAALVRALAEWQVDPAARRRLRLLAPACLVFWVPPLVGWEGVRGFSLFTTTSQSLLCFTVAAFTLIRRWLEGASPPSREPWLWVSSGAMLYYGTLALVSPLNRYLLAHGGGVMALQILALRHAIGTVAMLLYLRGVSLVPPAPRGRLAALAGA